VADVISGRTPPSGDVRPARLRSALTRPRGDFAWDGVVRGTGVIGLLAIPGVLLFSADFGAQVGFVLFTIWINGPIGMLLPATFEPVLMLFGRLYPPLLVAVLAVAGTLYVEFLNYHLYGTVIHLETFRPWREGRLVRRVIGLFERAPFLTVWVAAVTPLPFWTVRILAPLSRYPTSRFLFATFLGRFPRLWFFAALGAWWGVDIAVLVWISAASVVLASGLYLVRRWRHSRSAPG
jgi:membrane protein YqaA with SNARE-associated domain